MKKPTDYELKKWLCDNFITGLKIHHYQTGTDTASTDWELIPSTGKSKRLRDHTIQKLVNVRPDYNSVLQPLDSIVKEIEEWKKFAKTEAKELSEYERLKKKFGECHEKIKNSNM
jgi:hypothetical protein